MKKRINLVLLSILFAFGATAQICEDVVFELHTGGWGNEVSWSIVDNETGEQVYTSTEQYYNNSVYTEVVCLSGDNCYVLEMHDSFGDGWNGGFIYMTFQGATTEWQFYDGFEFFTSFNIYSVDPCEEFFYGCTDPNALNYNPDAQIEDGSCQYPMYGCTDSLAINYNPLATEDNGTCYYTLPGCTDPAAENYNPWATEDDGSCEYALMCDSGQVMADVYVCVFGNGDQIGFELSNEAGEILISQQGYNNGAVDHTDVCLEPGVCYTITASNLEGPLGWYGGYFWVNTMDGLQLITGELGDDESEGTFIFSIDGTCGEVYGCTDPSADNYNPDATIDDGSCYTVPDNDLCADAEPLIEGVTLIDNTGAVQNENIYGDCWASGSGEGEQTSLWYSFTTPDYPAQITIEAIGDGSYTLTDTQFGLFTECGGDMIYCDGNSGDGLLSMFEFACGELEENTEYILIVDGYYGDFGTCLLSYSVTDDCSTPVYGCTDPNALNYNPVATINDGSCVYQQDSCEATSIGLWFTPGAFISEVSLDIYDDAGNLVVSLSDLPSTSSYFEFCVEDGCYTLGLMDSFGDGWNGNSFDLYVNGALVLSQLTMFDGFEASTVFGVNSDDCEEEILIYGCTDPNAWNYNPLANTDDGSCYYDTTFTDCYAAFELGFVDQENDVVYVYNTSVASPDAYYVWDWGDGYFTVGEFATHNYENPGTYLVCLSVEGDGCYDMYCDSITYDPNGAIGPGAGMADRSVDGGWDINVIPESSVGVTDLDALENFLVYPSPASDWVTVKFESEEMSRVSIRILDLQGRAVYTQDGERIGNRSYLINVADLASGSYLIEVQSKGLRSVKHIEVLR